MEERITKLLARRGLASRRQVEQWIRDGRVAVNGRVVTEQGCKVDLMRDAVLVDGVAVPDEKPPRVLMLNKPIGYLSTCRKGREQGMEILDLVPRDRRYFPIGRLDRESSGLLLLTDDGALAHQLSHPQFGIRKTYVVDTHQPLSREQMDQLRYGILLDEGRACAEDVVRLAADTLQLTLTQGWKRQIRRMIRAAGGRVKYLHRTQIGNLKLGNLPTGHWRELTEHELNQLRWREE